MKKLLRTMFILLVLAGGFLYIAKNPELGIYQKLFPNHTVSVEDAYKLCNKTGCISTPVTIDAFMVGSSGVGVLTDAKKTNGYIQAGQTISLAPDKSMNLVEMYNFLNRDGYFLGNGILKIQVKGTLEYTPIFLDRLEDHVTLHFTMEDFKIIAQNGCLENGIAYESGVCFVPKQYSIDVNTAYDKLINSNLYKNAVQESTSRDVVKMRYDDTTQTWIFDISQENTPAPGCCSDQFEVSQEKILYKRICKINANAAKYGYADACADYYKNAFVQEESFGTQSGETNISITGSELTGTEDTALNTQATIGKYTVKTEQGKDIAGENIYLYDASGKKVFSLMAKDGDLQGVYNIIGDNIIIDVGSDLMREIRIYDILSNKEIFNSSYATQPLFPDDQKGYDLHIEGNKVFFSTLVYDKRQFNSKRQIATPKDIPTCPAKRTEDNIGYSELRSFDIDTKQVTKTGKIVCTFMQ